MFTNGIGPYGNLVPMPCVLVNQVLLSWNPVTEGLHIWLHSCNNHILQVTEGVALAHATYMDFVDGCQ